MWGPASGANYVDPLGLLKSTPIRLKPLSSEGRTLHYRQAEPVFVNEAAAGALAGAGHRKSPKQGVFRGAAQGGDIVARQPPGRWVCPSSAGGPIGWHRQ
ncbi:M23 peptidase domain-containing protein [Mycobacterium tuberculosis]|nr:M23 peptidase domain-containing protein [Mycobacterium tuberculosis]CKU11917.1 M23 peptidase domain-containing protein [Mycobacterium tuberculosis]CKU39805.1 M23 peptidase domain-containing protein [Mycobacterium tuberculosis]COW05865.1 M23 peptidase domain-containing protein [Mycobacterium tuberculosis]COW74771.1 M23 peptidase domain-containing protein [Mycobacterium tuberculosis]